MDINDLTKTQLILLGLLISFVTAIVTAIAVVSVMEQRSVPVTQTIYQVVKDTFNPQAEPEIPAVPTSPAVIPLSASDIVAKFKDSLGLLYADDAKTSSRPLVAVANDKNIAFISEGSLIELKKEYASLVNGVDMKIPATSLLERIVFFETNKKIGTEKVIQFDAPLPTAGDELYVIEGNPVSFDRVYVKSVSTDDAYGNRIELTTIPSMRSGALVVNKEGKALGILLTTETHGLVVFGSQLKTSFGL
jgi:hypothetical protein